MIGKWLLNCLIFAQILIISSIVVDSHLLPSPPHPAWVCGNKVKDCMKPAPFTVKSEDVKTLENFSYLLCKTSQIKWISKRQKWSAETLKYSSFRSSAIKRLYGWFLPLVDVGIVGTIADCWNRETELAGITQLLRWMEEANIQETQQENLTSWTYFFIFTLAMMHGGVSGVFNIQAEEHVKSIDRL